MASTDRSIPEAIVAWRGSLLEPRPSLAHDPVIRHETSRDGKDASRYTPEDRTVREHVTIDTGV